MPRKLILLGTSGGLFLCLILTGCGTTEELLQEQEVNQTIKTMATNGLSKVNKNPVAKEVVNNAATYGLQYGTNKVATGLSAG
jgi:hypothetical protein